MWPMGMMMIRKRMSNGGGGVFDHFVHCTVYLKIQRKKERNYDVIFSPFYDDCFLCGV